MNLILAILAFNIIVIIHEFGHFSIARLLGIKVYEFSLFMGPKIFSFNHKGTMFSIRLIPMLAYVAFDKEDSLYEDSSLNQHPIYKRAAVVIAGPLYNIISAGVAIALMVVMAGGYQSTIIDRVERDTPAAYAGLKEGDKVVGVNDKRIYQFMEVDLFISGLYQGETVTLEVERDGNTIPLKFTPQVIPENRYLLGFQAKVEEGKATNIIGSLQTNGPAEQAGLKPDDMIIGLDGQNITSMQQILNFMYNNKGEPVNVTVIRNGDSVGPIEIKPVQNRNPKAFYTGLIYRFENLGLGNLIKESAIRTYSFTRIGVYSIGWLFQGKIPANQMTGAVGAVDAIYTTVQQGANIREVVLILLHLSAWISIALGITNLLPIPPADGSKLLLLGLEAIRRKPIPQEKEAFIMMAGFVFMMALFVFTLYNDIARIIARAFGS